MDHTLSQILTDFYEIERARQRGQQRIAELEAQLAAMKKAAEAEEEKKRRRRQRNLADAVSLPEDK